MDSIDFNSYLDSEKGIINNSSGYDTYIKKSSEASDFIKKILDQIDEETRNCKPDPGKEQEFTKWLIFELFIAKRIRLDARKMSRKNEQNNYISATNKLQIAFDKIPESCFKGDLKDQNIISSYNFAKVLYYNELAICYSGLVKSSMSLGYAEQSIWLLEKLYQEIKNIDIKTKNEWKSLRTKIENDESPLTFSQIISLYTFALYNRGEAQRLLHNDDSSFKTFSKIVEIFKNWEKIEPDNHRFDHSDYIAASIRKGMMLVDMGRGREAGIVFEEIIDKISEDDYRSWDARLENSIALIDGKDYENAFKKLQEIEGKREQDTFIWRKAKICSVYLLNEFKKNRPEDFANKTDLTKKIERKSNEIIKYPNRILKKSIERKDGDNFKRTCTYLADYFRTKEKDGNNAGKNRDEALKYFYLYLFYRKFFEEEPKMEVIPEDSYGGIIDIWTNKDNKIKSLVSQYNKKYNLYDVLDRVEEEKYLKDFFDFYIKILNEKNRGKYACNEEIEGIIYRLKERLIYIYSQKENTISSERIEEKYNHLKERCREDATGKSKAANFIENYFFKVNLGKNILIKNCMRHDSIEEKMKRNTKDFVLKVVGKSEFPNEKEEKNKIIGRLNVLRRWNSFTPALRSPVNQSKGGGYFLYFKCDNKSLGIVIDPGYNFLENFFSQGFRIGDIDIVLVSHAHPDHTDNLPSILSLFHEMNDRLGRYLDEKDKNKKVLTLILSPGVFEQYNRIIKPSEEILRDIFVMGVKEGTIETTVYDEDFNKDYIVAIKAIGTSHEDLSLIKSQSFGFKIIVSDKTTNKPKSIIGYTSDAHWNKSTTKGWSNYFSDCTIICAHLGSIVNILKKKDFCTTFCNENGKCKNSSSFRNKCIKSGFEKANVTNNKLIEQTREENHLYLGGLASFFDDILSNEKRNLKLAIISEFGEELKEGIRIDLYKKFDNWFENGFKDPNDREKPRCLPGDIGLEIDVFDGKVCCHCCRRFVERDMIIPVPYGREEAICFVCKECESSLSSYQIGEKLKDYYENGRKLELANESR